MFLFLRDATVIGTIEVFLAASCPLIPETISLKELFAK
jgi:hypothetical protein